MIMFYFIKEFIYYTTETKNKQKKIISFFTYSFLSILFLHIFIFFYILYFLYILWYFQLNIKGEGPVIFLNFP